MSVQTSVALAPAIAFAGQIADGVAFDAITLKNAEASASMPFGAIVAFKTSSPTSDKDAILPAAAGALLAGVLLHKHNYERTWTMPDGTVAGELDATGLVVGVTFSCMQKGHVYVVCEDGCTVGAKLWVRYATGTLGAARSTDAGGSTCIDATTRGTWLSTALAAGIAKLACDFLSK
jgi:hypothetical protein